MTTCPMCNDVSKYPKYAYYLYNEIVLEYFGKPICAKCRKCLSVTSTNYKRQNVNFSVDKYILHRLYMLNRGFPNSALSAEKANMNTTQITILPNLIKVINETTKQVSYRSTIRVNGIRKSLYTVDLIEAIEYRLNNFKKEKYKNNFIEKLKIYLKENQ